MSNTVVFTSRALHAVLYCLTGILCFASQTYAQTRVVRVVTYNIAADTGGATGALPGLVAPWNDTNNFAAGGVLEGVGQEILSGNAQPIDVLALQETTSNSQTVQPIANALNTYYGVPGMYSNSTYQATSSGGITSGGGPNAMIYNTRTMQLLGSLPVNPPGGQSLGSSSGMYRQVVQYKFAPTGVATNGSNIFYVYVSHYKSGTGAANEAARQGEAKIIRTHVSTNVPPTARILYVGDFNTGIAAEGMYTNLINPGINQALDPINPLGATNLTWDDGTSDLSAKTFSSTSLRYRDDYQMMTTNVFYGYPGGLKLVSGTYHAFGNNGTVAYFANLAAGGNTALNGKLVTNGPVFIPAGLLYTNLTYASDHLPVVADYTIPMPAPRIVTASISGTNLTLSVTNGITNALYFLLVSTNYSTPFTNWAVIASNTPVTGNFTFTATNAINTNAPQGFYLLKAR